MFEEENNYFAAPCLIFVAQQWPFLGGSGLEEAVVMGLDIYPVLEPKKIWRLKG